MKEKIAQNRPATATVVKVGVFFLHLKETEKIENPNDDKRPIAKPNNVPTYLLVKAIKVIPIAAIAIEVKVMAETFSLRKIYPNMAVINGIAANIKSVTAAVVWVIDHIKHIMAMPRDIPPIIPEAPIFL